MSRIDPAPVLFGAQRDFMLPAFEALALSHPCVLIRRPEALTASLIDRLGPRAVVLPDWSWIVPQELLQRTPFIGFHAAALPDYRGGSPLQHQILDGLTETTLTMFRIAADLDGGPILSRAPLSLDGTIAEIWKRIATLVPPMVNDYLAGSCAEQPQRSGGFSRRRRTPEQSRIEPSLGSLDEWWNFLRALDDPYPNPFLIHGGVRISFRTPRREGDTVVAEAVIEPCRDVTADAAVEESAHARR